MESTGDTSLPSCQPYNPGLYLLKSWHIQKQWVSGEIWCSLSICILENIHIFLCCTILSSLSARSNDTWYDPYQVQTRCSPCSSTNLASLLSLPIHHQITIQHIKFSYQQRKKRYSLWRQPPGVIHFLCILVHGRADAANCDCTKLNTSNLSLSPINPSLWKLMSPSGWKDILYTWQDCGTVIL